MADALLTLYALPGDNSKLDNFERLAKNLTGPMFDVVKLAHRDDLKGQKPTTRWWGYLYGNEWFDKDIAEVLNIYMLRSDADCLVFYKKVRKSAEESKKAAFYLAARLFRTQYVPCGIEEYKTIDGLKFETCLDGWVMEQDRI